ncbi:MAG: ribosome maturation factor RimP [Jatrophihabitans sp.]|uniref:ribosome maturation factor RimP n=1 Tax=Jatrophihabitans sp. TaxID=1932789 RepID=UPI003F81CF20
MSSASGRSSGSSARERERLLDTLTPLVREAGYDLEDISVTAAGRRNLVRVIVDRDGGIDLDAVADVSRLVSDHLDADGDGFAGPYVLEVSSPGVDRPLTEPRHWRRAKGRLVSVTSGDRKLTGRVVDTDDRGVQLDVDGSRHRFGYDELGPGRIQVEFQHAPGHRDDGDTDDTDSDTDSDTDIDIDTDIAGEHAEEGGTSW